MLRHPGSGVWESGIQTGGTIGGLILYRIRIKVTPKMILFKCSVGYGDTSKMIIEPPIALLNGKSMELEAARSG